MQLLLEEEAGPPLKRRKQFQSISEVFPVAIPLKKGKFPLLIEEGSTVVSTNFISSVPTLNFVYAYSHLIVLFSLIDIPRYAIFSNKMS